MCIDERVVIWGRVLITCRKTKPKATTTSTTSTTTSSTSSTTSITTPTTPITPNTTPTGSITPTITPTNTPKIPPTTRSNPINLVVDQSTPFSLNSPRETNEELFARISSG